MSILYVEETALSLQLAGLYHGIQPLITVQKSQFDHGSLGGNKQIMEVPIPDQTPTCYNEMV